MPRQAQRIPKSILIKMRGWLELKYTARKVVYEARELDDIWRGVFKPVWMVGGSSQVREYLADLGVVVDKVHGKPIYILNYLSDCSLSMRSDTSWEAAYNNSEKDRQQVEGEKAVALLKISDLNSELQNIRRFSDSYHLQTEVKEVRAKLEVALGRVKELEGFEKQPQMGEYIPPEDYSKIKASLQSGFNVFLRGPTGCGKTLLSRILAKDMGVQFWSANFNGETTYESFVGMMNVRGGSTVWTPGALHAWFSSEAGGLFLADEVDFMPPAIASILHPVLETPRRLTISEYSDKAVSPGNLKKSYFIAAANTFGRGDDTGLYVGTSGQNAAYLRRYGAVYKMDYSLQEVDILASLGVEKKWAEELREFAKEIRKGEMVHVTFCTQTLKDVARLSLFMDREAAFQVGFINRLQDDEVVEVKAHHTYKRLQRYFN